MIFSVSYTLFDAIFYGKQNAYIILVCTTFEPIKQAVIREAGFESEKEAKQKYGKAWNVILANLIEQYAYNNADSVVSVRDPHKPTDDELKDNPEFALSLMIDNDIDISEYLSDKLKCDKNVSAYQ